MKVKLMLFYHEVIHHMDLKNSNTYVSARVLNIVYFLENEGHIYLFKFIFNN